jgi:hypothetical protein
MDTKNFDYYYENYLRELSYFQIMNEQMLENTAYSMIESSVSVINEDEYHSKLLGTPICEFYKAVESWKEKWKNIESAPITIEGSVNILPIEDVLNWNAWDFEPDLFPQMENFTVLDWIDDSHVVGLYLGQPKKGLFYMNMDSNPQSINLDFNGYLEMTKYTKAVFLWQLGCIEPIVDKTSHRYLEKLTQLDPTITVKGFYELFDRLRIDK